MKAAAKFFAERRKARSAQKANSVRFLRTHIFAVTVFTVFAFAACSGDEDKSGNTSSAESTVSGNNSMNSSGSSAPAHVHQWGAWTINTLPTAAADGGEERACSACDDKENRSTSYSGTAGLAYELNGSGTGYIVRKGSVAEGIVYIPTMYSGLPVSQVGGESESPGAFEGTAITSVIFLAPSNITSIGNYAFTYCYALTSVTIPDSVTTIRQYAFRQCTALTSVIIPDSVMTIADYAFDLCDALASVSIGSGVTSIGDGVFRTSPALASIAVDAANPNYASQDGILYNKAITTLIKAPPAGIAGAFAVPNSVTSIGNSAFMGCTALTSVTIGSGVTTIGDLAFRGCTALTSITVDAANLNYASQNGILYNKAMTTVIQASPAGIAGAFAVPNSVTSIGRFAFEKCISLASVTMPDSVEGIGQSAFSGCSALTSVTIGNGVTEIGFAAFEKCTSLASVTMPDSVTIIGNFAFDECAGLTSVTIGSGVMSIGAYAFFGCSALTSVTVLATTPPALWVSGDVFRGNHSTRQFYVPAGSVEVYKAASEWSTYADRIVAIP